MVTVLIKENSEVSAGAWLNKLSGMISRMKTKHLFINDLFLVFIALWGVPYAICIDKGIIKEL